MIFIRKEEVLRIHERALAEFGGSPGLRDEGALESALVAAENRAWYENADAVACAATYGYHLTMGHAFVDGNKRVAAAATESFLVANDVHLLATDDELYELFMSIAAGDRTRESVEGWLKNHVQP